MLLYLRNLSFKVALLLYLCFSSCLAYTATDKVPIIWNVGNPNEFFVGRNDYIKQLNESFLLSENNSKVIAIVGSAGIGKTQLAKRYAESYRTDYDIVWWFDSEKNMEEQFIKFATKWNQINTQENIQNLKVNIDLPPDEIIKQLKNHLRTTKYSWLLIFDNVADNNQVLSYIPQKHNSRSYGHILVTSKNPLIWNDKMELDNFTRSESIELLIKITGNNDRLAADRLADTLKDFPLALVQASSYIRSHPSINMDQYRELFLTKRKELWKEDNKKNIAFDNYEFTVFTTISLILKKIEQESPNSVELLAFCAFLSNKNIPKIFLTQYLSANTNLTDLRQEDAIAYLARYSLITHQNINLDYNNVHLSNKVLQDLRTTFTMHEITQLAVQDYLSKKEQKLVLQKGLKVIADFLPDKFGILLPLLEQNNSLLPHIQIIANNAEKHRIYNNDLIKIYLRELDYYFVGKRNFDKGKELIEKIESIIPTIPIDNINLFRLYWMKDIYYACCDLDYQKGIKEVKEALKLLDEIEGNHDEEYLMAYNALIQSYSYLGDNENALKYVELGKEIIKKASVFLSNKDVFFHSLAKVYRDNEQFDKALSYTSQATDLASKRGNGIIIGDLPYYFVEADILIKANHSQEAYIKITKLFAVLKDKMKNIEHPYLANIMIFYGYSSFLVKNKGETNYNIDKDMILSGQNMLKKTLGIKYNKNRNAALSHKFIGEIFEKEGDISKAQTEYVISERIYKNIYNMKMVKIGDISDLYTRLAIINVKFGDSVTAQHYLDLHRKIFGYDHPRTDIITQYMFDNGMRVSF